MNLDFHSNHVKTLDRGFHSKCTPASIYTSDPSDPDVIPLWDRYFSTGTGAGKADDFGVQNYQYVHMCSLPFVIPLSGERAEKESIPPTRTDPCSCYWRVGSRRVYPTTRTENKARPSIGRQSFVIPLWDQGGITGITSFPLEMPSARAIARQPDRSARGCMSPPGGRGPRAVTSRRAAGIPRTAPAATGLACHACHLPEASL